MPKYPATRAELENEYAHAMRMWERHERKRLDEKEKNHRLQGLLAAWLAAWRDGVEPDGKVIDETSMLGKST